jgi:cyclopropane-fatty-acyl-phospholipid synthase
MNGISPHPAEQAKTVRGLCDRMLRRLVWRRLESLADGHLTIMDHGERQDFGQPGECSPKAILEVLDPRFYRDLVFGGSLGAAEAYIRGYWTCDDLVSLVQLFCRNPAVSSGLEGGPARLLNPLARFAHWLRRNTASGSRRNIAAHYDLGNEFFALFLDETMAYSCAVFPRIDSTLHEASVAKFDRICQKLALTAEDHLLEIGTGWGGFTLYAAKEYGCRVTTTTISPKQHEYSRQQVVAAGLSDRITVLCEDYRALTGSFDKLVSIEMIEAVGYQYLDTYFRICSERLKPHGMMLLQAIVIPDQRYDRYRRSVDFIQRYIFPGGCLPSVGAICHSLGRVTDLQLSHLEDITPHYAETLAMWRQRFRANLDQVRQLGFSEEFIRTWEFYFCYCEGGFRERAIGDVQILLTKPAWQPTAIAPQPGAPDGRC